MGSRVSSVALQWYQNQTPSIFLLCPTQEYLGMSPHGCKVAVMVPSIECKHNNAQLKKKDVSTHEVFLIREKSSPSPISSVIIGQNWVTCPALLCKGGWKVRRWHFNLLDERFSAIKKGEGDGLCVLIISSDVILHLDSTFAEVLAQASHTARHPLLTYG